MNQYKNKKQNTPKLTVINVCLLVVIIVAYLAQVALLNQAANQRYVYASMLTEFDAVQADVRQLSAQSAALQSTSRLSAESARLNLVAAETVNYVRPVQPVVLNR